MKTKWLRSTLALLLTASMVLSSAVTVRAEEASVVPLTEDEATPTDTPAGTIYYVDSEYGSDENDGTSAGKAFQTLDKVNELDLKPGDKVLLKKGSVFKEQALCFDKADSGTEDAPVIISSYGDGDKRPHIQTDGQGQWEQNFGAPLDNTNHKWHGTVSSCILIKDTEYIEISGLELSNQIGDGSTTINGNKETVAYNDAYAMDRTGVAGVAQDNGTVDHIVLDDLYIHDIKGNVYNKHMCNGGIYFVVQKPADEGATGIARYNDVQIKNCHLDTVNRWGIAVGYTYQHAQFDGKNISDDTMSKYGSSNVVIENNYLNHVGGDAITTMYLDESIVQYNVAENIAEQINYDCYTDQQPVLNADGSDSGNKQDVGAGRVAAGIWPWKCKDAVFQFNECFSVLNASKGNGDGQPWDADSGDGTLYQYNYSHGNSASTIMFCYPESVDTTFRYNISVNEDMGPLDPANNAGNAHVYNNTFIIKEGITSIWYRDSGPVTCENNIFYFLGDTPRTIKNWNPNGNKTFDNNLYYNVSNYPNDENAVKVNAGTEVFVDVASAPTAPATDGASRFDSEGKASSEFNGLKLSENSPAINTGKKITDLNRDAYTASNIRDFFGEAIGEVPEIGAAASSVTVSLALRSNEYSISGKNISGVARNTTVEHFLENIMTDKNVTVTVKDGENALGNSDIVKGGMTVVLSYGERSEAYTIVASSDSELKSAYYMVADKNIYVPYTEKNPTTVKELKNSLEVAASAEVTVLNGDKTLEGTDNVAEGMIVRITAEDDKTTNDYTIKQKNTYNWTLDYINGKQGNVWFAQMKTGSGAWENMTTVDSEGWPNWAVSKYYGPGVNAEKNTTNMTADMHGLLSAPPSEDITTAMVFRAPKTGVVSFSIKDDEPYLRQDGNSGGTVTVSLLVNDEVKQSVKLETSKVKASDWKSFDEIEVTKGDYIRVTAYTNGNATKPSLHITPNISYVDQAVEISVEPKADAVVPDANQYKYQKDELAAFCHFGPNTFNGYEWGFEQGSQTWYYKGKKPNEIFRLNKDFDAYNYVKALKDAGFKKLIVTAKHHDGFCIWNSEQTDYCIRNTDYYKDRHVEGDDVKGDVLAEISKACTDLGMDMGLYLSPWDVAEESYGADGGGKDNAYNEFYNEQLKEILGNKIYGRDGHFVEVWMDGANGYENKPQSYDFERWYKTIQKYEGIAAGYESDCMLFGAQAYTTVRWIGNESGLAAEDTWAKSTVNYDKNTIDSNSQGSYTVGFESGNKWTVPECDGRITSGWFWGSSKSTPLSLKDLSNMYFNSVGHNSTLLLNVPPNDQGTVDQAILDRIAEFGENIQDTFRNNLLKADGTTITASEERSNRGSAEIDFKASNIVDGDDATYWTTEDGTSQGTLTIQWNAAKTFDVVSIEEAIQKGQHINSYKVEYKTSDTSSWTTLKEGTVIGSKRLIRTAPVSATQVKITVGTTADKVPMLSEVGIYKASQGFQLSGSAPDGMDVISVTDSQFTFSTGWNPQTGTEYIKGQNTWSSAAGATATLKFTGSKIYLMGTLDSGHGKADIYIDGKLVETIDTKATSRSTGSLIFESADLEHQEHTIQIVTKDTSANKGAIGLEAAYVINNGGKGMLELEESSYTMGEDETLAVKIKRVGGTKGRIEAALEPNPGTAIQKHFDTELIPQVVLEEGQSELVIDPAARSIRVPEAGGDVYFTLNLTSKDQVIGMNSSAKVVIKDTESFKDELQTLVSNSESLQESLYVGQGWSAFTTALAVAREVLEDENATAEEIKAAYTALETAKAALTARESYTEEDRFEFPVKIGESKTLEAEFATTISENCGDKDWPCSVSKDSWASNGKFLNSLNATASGTDTVTYAYKAERAGTYLVTVTYRSGSDENTLAWSETDGKITAGSIKTPNSKENGVLKVGTVEFTMVVEKAGEGTLVLKPENTGNAPQLDKLDIRLVTPTAYIINAEAGEHGTITPAGKVEVTPENSQTFTMKADDGYVIESLTVDGEEKEAAESYIFENVSDDHTIKVTFKKAVEETPEEPSDPSNPGTDSKDDTDKPSEVYPAPSKPSNSTSSDHSGSSANSTSASTTGTKTGDSANMGIWAVVLLAAAAAGVVIVLKRKNNGKKEDE